MHHGTHVTHVPWCMSRSLTGGDGENVPGIPGACAPAIMRIWQEVHWVNSHQRCQRRLRLQKLFTTSTVAAVTRLSQTRIIIMLLFTLCRIPRQSHYWNTERPKICAQDLIFVMPWFHSGRCYLYTQGCHDCSWLTPCLPSSNDATLTHLGSNLLTWINFNSYMDNYYHRPLYGVTWNHVSIPKLQRCSRWSFGLNK